MKVLSSSVGPSAVDVDAVVVGVGSNKQLVGAAAELDRGTGGLLQRLLERDYLATKRFSVTQILAPAGIPARQLLVVGLGEPPPQDDAGYAFRLAGTAAKALATKRLRSIAFYLDVSPTWAAIAGARAAVVGQDLYRAEKKLFPPDELIFSGAAEEAVARGSVIGDAIKTAKDLINGPPNVVYPESLAERCRELGSTHGFDVEIWDEQRLLQERCHALLAVASGSDRPPRLVIMRHHGGRPGTAPVALVGKGVTFDSGGLSIKPSESMADMKVDMSGSAAVIGAMQAIAALKIPLHVVGLIGCVENMLNGRAYKLGDVITARSGKTIEILNTDAEGRVVLADVLDVALEQNCQAIVDLATLTGACVVALGQRVAGAMTNSQAWCDQVVSAARYCGDDVWQLPMYPDYDEQIKSPVADIKNIGEGRWGGAITGAKFLEQFVGTVPWVHLDIAGPASLDKPLPWADAGATGCFVNTLIELAHRLATQGTGSIPQKA